MGSSASQVLEVFRIVENWFGCCDETEACCLSFYREYLQSHVQKRVGLLPSKFENTQWRKVGKHTVEKSLSTAIQVLCVIPSPQLADVWACLIYSELTRSNAETFWFSGWFQNIKEYIKGKTKRTAPTCQTWTDNRRFGRKSRWLQSHPRRFWWLQVHKKFINNFTENLWLGSRRALCSKHLLGWDRCTLAEHDIGLERRSRRSFPAKAATVLATLQWPPTLRFVRLQIWTKDFRNSSSYVLSICYFLGSSDDDWTYWILKYLLYHLESAISKQDK